MERSPIKKSWGEGVKMKKLGVYMRKKSWGGGESEIVSVPPPPPPPCTFKWNSPYPIYKNDHSNLIQNKMCFSMSFNVPIHSRSETFEIFPWTQTNTENLAKYNWVSFSQKSCVWESK